MGRSHEAPPIREPMARPPAKRRRGLTGEARKKEESGNEDGATEATYWRIRGGRKRRG